MNGTRGKGRTLPRKKKERPMENGNERNRPWTAEEKERFLDRVGGYELSSGELDPEETRSLLKGEAGRERP